MDKVKISEVALETGSTAKEIISKAKDLNIDLKSSNSSVTMEQAGIISEYLATGKLPAYILKAKQEQEEKENKAKLALAKKAEQEALKKTAEAKKEKSKENTTEVEKIKEVQPKEVQSKSVQPKEEISKTIEPQNKTSIKPPEAKETKQDNSLYGLSKQRKKQVQEDVVQDNVSQKPKKPKTVKKQTQQNQPKKQKITINTSFNSNLDVENDNESNVLMPDFDARDEILKKFEKANSLLNKNKNTNQRPKNPFSKQNKSPERGKSRRRPTIHKEKIISAIKIPIDVRVHEFALKINQEEASVISELLELGITADKNDFLEKDHMELLSDTFSVKIEFVSEHLDEINYVDKYELTGKQEDMQERAPVVTIMGHVDHGKTTLLDVIRGTKVTEGEAGGITQHIGAYMIDYKGHLITFIDTPGHAAFDKMRARGSQITDIIVIVVAADDGIKDQTIESINHAKKAGVPIIVAITKIDKQESNIDMVKSKMAEQDLTPTDWGGDIDFIALSAKTKEGIDTLLETISVQAQLLECKANPSKKAKGIVIEASIEHGKGPAATLIMQDGTLKIGDYIVVDTVSGKVRSIINDDGKSIKSALPGMPIKITGLDNVPHTGSILVSMNNAKEVKALAQKRSTYERQIQMSKTTKVSIEDLTDMISENKLKSLPIVLKADFNGSLEAIKLQIEDFKNEEVKVNIISSGVGGISENDLDLADITDNCIIFGFNVRPTGSIKQKADKKKITISTYSIIYELLDEVKSMLSGLMSPIIKEENTGQAEVKDVFKTPKGIAIAGCVVSDGKVVKGGLARVIRKGVVICDNSHISSLKRFKDNVSEVTKGYECGIAIEEYNDVQVGDVIETFIEKKERQQL
ncbi:Translation initiation factor 2 [hydrothermal vent metagenome]|uniref:Translation initiation factor 2 n=1 Tax=hydrothermal vent metagenome TaxID=652676 RepID=A0A3B1E5N8_9ZZZZ